MSFFSSIYEWLYAPDSLWSFFEENGVFVYTTVIIIITSFLSSLFYYFLWQPDTSKQLKWFFMLLINCFACYSLNVVVSLLLLDIDMAGLWGPFFSFFLTTPTIYSAIFFIPAAFIIKPLSPATYNIPF